MNHNICTENCLCGYLHMFVSVCTWCQSTSKEKYVVLMIIFFLRVMSKKFLREIGRQMSRKRRRQLGSLVRAAVCVRAEARNIAWLCPMHIIVACVFTYVSWIFAMSLAI